jgi:hypothetical protein
MDLAFLKPLFSSTSAVYFKRGYLTLRSSDKIRSDKLVSSDRLVIQDYEMVPAAAWSPESQSVLSALNRHKEFGLAFDVTGTPDAPVFDGFENALMGQLEKDFGPQTMAILRQRTRQETGKLAESFRKS